MDFSKPAAKEEEIEPISPKIIITPKNDLPPVGQRKKIHPYKPKFFKKPTFNKHQSGLMPHKIPNKVEKVVPKHDFRLSSKVKNDENSNSKNMSHKAYLDSVTKTKLDDEISTISTRSEYMNGNLKSLSKQNLGIRTDFNKQRNPCMQSKTPQERHINSKFEQSDRKTTGFLGAYQRRVNRDHRNGIGDRTGSAAINRSESQHINDSSYQAMSRYNSRYDISQVESEKDHFQEIVDSMPANLGQSKNSHSRRFMYSGRTHY